MPNTDHNTGLYSGRKRKLVLAFDIGTTYSGVSYSVLDPGQTPEIKGVARFPASQQVNGASKIHTVMYYDQRGKMVAAGAEAVREGIYEIATDEGWDKTEWFKLHVRSQRGTTIQPELEQMLPPLPPNKTVVQIMADFMHYLHECAKSYIQDTHVNGRDLWESVEQDIDYVITHPNGWEGYQQSQMCDAAIMAGLIPNSDQGKKRIIFLTEGEASLHYAIRNGLPAHSWKNGEGVIIVDAGGGTVDVSAYRKLPGGEMFEEIAVPQCHFFGSVFVSINAKIFISQLLSESVFLDDIEHIVRRFDDSTKLRFRSDAEPQYIRFGGNRDNDEAFGIRYGQLKLRGKDVAMFFAPSIECIVNAVLSQAANAHNPISHVVLVGGFASSDWLYSQVQNALVNKKMNIVRPENYINKAVSDGAVSFYLHSQVDTRVSKYAYGEFYNSKYNPSDPEHVKHEKSVYVSPSTGRKQIRGSFHMMIAKNTKIEEKQEHRETCNYCVASLDSLKSVALEIWCYKGDNPVPRWKDEEPEMFSRLCRIENDLSQVKPKKQERENGGSYYKITFDYILYYEGVEMKAQAAWRENGVEKRCPARVIYDPTD